jgi:hypothetical protein
VGRSVSETDEEQQCRSPAEDGQDQAERRGYGRLNVVGRGMRKVWATR